ncbi:MAG: hypothetical protein ACHQNE_07710 [Candidatus Kapaibacterium sp.]
MLSLTAPLAAFGQSNSSVADSTPKDASSAYLFAGIGGFIPLDESYRVNYSTSLGGIPMEVSGGFLFPVGPGVFVPLTARYVRREANFVTGTSIEVLSIEPGIRFFLEREHEHDLRMFGAVEALLGQATVQGNYDATADGTTISAATAQSNYYDLGLGFDLGLTYPLTSTTALDASVHIAIFLASPVTQGGLGNIGGVSLTAAYRFGF